MGRRVPLHVTSRSMRSRKCQHRGPVCSMWTNFSGRPPQQTYPGAMSAAGRDAGHCRENGQWKCPHARAFSGAPRTSASIGRDAVSDLNLRLPRLVNVMLTPKRCLASFVAVCGHIHHNARVMRSDARSDLSGKGSLSSHILLIFSWRQHCQCEFFF